MRLAFKVLIGVFLVLVGILGYSMWAITAENPSPVTAVNPQSSGPKALVISDPGISGFEQGVADSFASGLTTNGWHVEVTTASSQTPTDLTEYTLVAFVSPIYGGEPSVPMQSYLTRLGSLAGKRVAVVLTGAGAGSEALQWMKSRVVSMGGGEVLSIAVYSMSLNEPQFGSSDAQGIAEAAAESLQP